MQHGPPSRVLAAPTASALGTYKSLAPAAQFGLLRPIAGALVDPAYPADLRDEMTALRSRSTTLVGVTGGGGVASRSGPSELEVVEEALRERRLDTVCMPPSTRTAT